MVDNLTQYLAVLKDLYPDYPASLLLKIAKRHLRPEKTISYKAR